MKLKITQHILWSDDRFFFSIMRFNIILHCNSQFSQNNHCSKAPVISSRLCGQWSIHAACEELLSLPCFYAHPQLRLVSVPLRWRLNGSHGVSNHQHHGCLLNRLFRRKSKKTPTLRVTGLCAGNSPGPVNYSHKWPVKRKMFPFHDVIMQRFVGTHIGCGISRA